MSRRLTHARDVLRELIARDMKLRYRGSFFGMAWTLLNPVAELLVLLFVFDSILTLDIPNYGPFLFIGLLVYGWFQSSLYYSTVAVVNGRDLIRRPDVPAAVLPVVTVTSSLLHFLLSLPVLFVLLVFSHVPLTSAMLALPLLIAVQFVMILGLAYPLATLHVWFRDTQYFLRVALQLLFYLTPVFYQSTAVPQRFHTIYLWNPMVWVIEGYRDILLRGRWPSARDWSLLLAASLVVLAAGHATFRRASHRFADEL